jgi:hypothetical protein
VIKVGDYVRWVSGIAVYSADVDGTINPIEKIYNYGIVVEVAEAGEIGDDVIIAFCSKDRQWFVSAINDPEYEIELVSRGKDDSDSSG